MNGADPAPGQFDRVLRDAQVIVVGPAPPLRGGIAAHTAGLVGHLRSRAVGALAVSYSRLYPRLFFPGTSQRVAGQAPPWSVELLDVLSPLSWLRTGRLLASSKADVILQWWHPVVAPALLAATRGLPRRRLIAVCHNVLPHERLPGAAVAARALLGRCGRLLCHSRSEAAAAAGLLEGCEVEISVAPLPCLLSVDAPTSAAAPPPELAGLGSEARLMLCAGHVRAYKGAQVLLEAWRRAARPPAAGLLVVGESYLRGRARRKVAELAAGDSSIILVDRYVSDEDLVSFMQSCEALVLSHVAASQSGMIPLARRLGLPCIVTDAGALAEQAGADSTVVRAGDAAALAAAIEHQFARGPAAVRTASPDRSAGTYPQEWQAVVEAMAIRSRP